MNGILNLNKPKGITAHDAVAKVRKLAGTKRVGHAGTLDPAASGVLPICIGNATRIAEYLSDAGKAYRARIALGLATPSYDLETAPTITLSHLGEGQGGGDSSTLARLAALSVDEIAITLETFLGPQMQTPPMYSALHVGGQRLYELARAGREIEREPRPITIYSLKLCSFAPLTIAGADYPTLTVDVECSKGTYIRSLAVDIGVKLGVPAVLAALTRTRSGPFRLADAHSLGVVELAAQLGRFSPLLYPADYALRHLPRLDLSPEDERKVLTGQAIDSVAEADDGSLARAYSTGGRFAAILRREADKWRPAKVFKSEE